MKKIAIFIDNNFEEIEALASADILARAGLCTTLISCHDNKLICGKHKICVSADRSLKDFKAADYDVYLLPGGPHVERLLINDVLLKIIKEGYQAKKIIAAICAAPLLLDKCQILINHKFTCYPTIKNKISNLNNFVTDKVVISDNIITSQGPGTTFDFALTLVRLLCNDAVANKVASGMVYDIK